MVFENQILIVSGLKLANFWICYLRKYKFFASFLVYFILVFLNYFHLFFCDWVIWILYTYVSFSSSIYWFVNRTSERRPCTLRRKYISKFIHILMVHWPTDQFSCLCNWTQYSFLNRRIKFLIHKSTDTGFLDSRIQCLSEAEPLIRCPRSVNYFTDVFIMLHVLY